MMSKAMKAIYFQRALLKKHKRPPKRLKRQLYPERVEAQYLRSLIQILEFTRYRVNYWIKPLIPKLVAHMGRDRKDEDLGDLADELKQIRLEVSQAYSPDEISRLAKLTGRNVAEFNAEQMNGQMRGIVEIDLFGSGGEPWLAKEMGAFVQQNVELITSLPDEYLDQVSKLIGTSVRSGLRSEEIATLLEDRYGVGKSRAQLIARDQIGKFNGQLTEARQRDLGVDEYTWRGVGDARERDSHRALNNTVQRWDDPPDVGHPGEDIQCRCWAEPVLDKFYDEEEEPA